MMFRFLILTILLATLLGGCAQNRDFNPKQRSELYTNGATGKRIVITDHNNQPVLKIRARRDSWKTYDQDLRATGFVRWSSSTPSTATPEQQNAPSLEQPTLHIETIGRDKTATFQAVHANNEVFELPGHLRIEKIESGWAVFAPDAKLLGLFERELLPTPSKSEDPNAEPSTQPAAIAHNERWTLRADYNSPTLWTANQEGLQITARHKDGTTYTTLASHLSPPAVLATELISLPALDRAALAAWFIHLMPPAAS